MPTLIKVDSFQHRVLRVAQVSNATAWYAVTEASTIPCHDGVDITFDTGQPRTADHACSLKLVGNASTNVQAGLPLGAGNQNVNGSIYFRVASAPSVTSRMIAFAGPASSINMDSSGHIVSQHAGGVSSQTSSGTYADGNWHRLDFYANSSASPNTLDVQIDGVANSQSSRAQAATDTTRVDMGTVAGDTLTAWYSDLVLSNTPGDYPIGDHICKFLRIDGKGTHSQGSGAFQDGSGSATDDFEVSVDDAWDGTTPELSQTGEDYVQQTANDAAGYVEFTLQDPSESTIWGAQLDVLMAAEDSTQVMNCESRLVDSGGTTLATTGLVDPSISNAAYTGIRPIATSAPSGGWSGTSLGACKVRFGYSTDTTPDAIFNAGGVEYAAPWTAPAAASLLVPRRYPHLRNR